MLLEEAMLALLRVAGYRTIVEAGRDPTLQNGPAGLVVVGRGARHQIDAIADFGVGQPFSNPQRLLVEGKFYRKPVELSVIRGVVGTLKDVSEAWFRSHDQQPAARRYHYQGSVFSASAFTRQAQDYA